MDDQVPIPSRELSAVGYARISVEDKRNTSVSIDAQRAAIQLYCSMRGLNLIALYVDEGVSAATMLTTRPQGRHVIEVAGAAQIGHVVAFKLDRLFRNAFDCLGVVQEWDKRGVAMHLTSQGGSSIDTRSAMGKFFLTVLAGFAEMERNLISERTATAMRYKASRGERVGTLPYGWTTEFELSGRQDGDRKQLILNPNEVATVARIVALHASGISLRKIAHTLNGDGTPSRGARWHATGILRIIEQAYRTHPRLTANPTEKPT